MACSLLVLISKEALN